MAAPSTLQRELAALNKDSRLSAAVDDVDKMIELLRVARDQVAASLDPHTASLTMTKLQNPIKERLEAVNDDLKKVSRVQKELGKALDKSFPLKPLPTDHDAMKDQLPLINRAIAMHLLREGQFDVASTFIEEAGEDMPVNLAVTQEAEGQDVDMTMSETRPERRDVAAAALHPEELQEKFTEMYSILQELKARNLVPAIDWARRHSGELEARGSNLEFELSKLQFVWLFKGESARTDDDSMLDDDTAQHNGSNGSIGGHLAALAYARVHFARFQARHLGEIQQLASAMAFAPNLSSSPYAAVFATGIAFADVGASFTREFCSLLGLSAESPLYVAATAGALALPQLVKYVARVREKRTEWTTASELAFETPLPASMMYHSIFVCPVSKDQTTDANPPMLLPCGHVLAHESLQNLAKGSRFKCPYCPSEGQLKDARQIIL